MREWHDKPNSPEIRPGVAIPEVSISTPYQSEVVNGVLDGIYEGGKNERARQEEIRRIINRRDQSHALPMDEAAQRAYEEKLVSDFAEARHREALFLLSLGEFSQKSFLYRAVHFLEGRRFRREYEHALGEERKIRARVERAASPDRDIAIETE